jgi:hypothetical protein
MFLPATRDEMNRIGWSELDVILVTGDTYIDSPYHGAAVVGQVLAKAGFRVGHRFRSRAPTVLMTSRRWASQNCSGGFPQVAWTAWWPTTPAQGNGATKTTSPLVA